MGRRHYHVGGVLHLRRTSPRARRLPCQLDVPSSSAATGSRSPAPAGPTRTSANRDLLTAALDGLVARFGLAGERLGEVAAGAVLKHTRDFNLTREAVLGSALAHDTPAYDVQMACATGMETVVALANKIRLGQLEAGSRRRRRLRVGRTDRGERAAARAPCSTSNRARTRAAKLAAVARIRPGTSRPSRPTSASRAPGCRWASTRR